MRCERARDNASEIDDGNIFEGQHLPLSHYLLHKLTNMDEIRNTIMTGGDAMRARTLILDLFDTGDPQAFSVDRKSVVWGKGVLGRVDLGGRRIIKKKKKKK